MPTVLFFHGNGDSLAGAARATQQLADAGFGLMLAEYRGYGGNAGKPDEAGLRADGGAAIRWLLERRVALNDVIVVGHSLGSGVATQVAADHRVRALVLVSGFSSLRNAVVSHLPLVPVAILLRDHFDNMANLRRSAAPVLIVHGKRDRTIPVDEAISNAKASPRSTLKIFDRAGHELAYDDQAQRTIVDWLQRLLAERERAGPGTSPSLDGSPPISSTAQRLSHREVERVPGVLTEVARGR